MKRLEIGCKLTSYRHWVSTLARTSADVCWSVICTPALSLIIRIYPLTSPARPTVKSTFHTTDGCWGIPLILLFHIGLGLGLGLGLGWVRVRTTKYVYTQPCQSESERRRKSVCSGSEGGVSLFGTDALRVCQAMFSLALWNVTTQCGNTHGSANFFGKNEKVKMCWEIERFSARLLFHRQCFKFSNCVKLFL